MATPPLAISLERLGKTMQAKALLPTTRIWLLAMLGGAYIALAGFASTVAACNLLASPDSYGLGRCVAGLLFPVGLILIIVGGGELFTGNCMMTEAVRRKLLNPVDMLRNWLLVYLGNFTGAVLVAGLLFLSGLFVSGKGQVATAIIKTAVDKAKLGGLEALILGIFCNWLVCLAIWLASRSEKAAHKAFLLFFPIWLFVTSGYEHSVANMYYLSAGLLAVLDPPTLAASGLEPGIVEALGVMTLTRNMCFVTLGNIVGGAIFVAGAYALAYGQDIP